ncbi:UNVERIFIED_CONTAM: hypothetical protein PYX00_009715 [Menopon gallinae]|uniref:Gamma-secretase subunit Aph-1 n=1 Tax=Menopon gallinae TaxID=328185 RepID=A0AAW2HCV5_9NEOP
MTVVEFFGCAFLAFGPPLAMFVFTIAIDPIRIIILIASSFFWLLSLLISSLFWLAIPKEHLSIGMLLSVLFQELFRFIVYKVLRSAEGGLKKITDDDTQLIENKHILAYVAGLGFGIISGMFSLINVLADSVGPGTVGLIQGSEKFFMTSAATTLCFILLHTFWGIIFFSALDSKNYVNLAWVIVSHLLVSGLTFLNQKELYIASILPCYVIMAITGLLAFKLVMDYSVCDIKEL